MNQFLRSKWVLVPVGVLLIGAVLMAGYQLLDTGSQRHQRYLLHTGDSVSVTQGDFERQFRGLSAGERFAPDRIAIYTNVTLAENCHHYILEPAERGVHVRTFFAIVCIDDSGMIEEVRYWDG